jgi:hypothetical protein
VGHAVHAHVSSRVMPPLTVSTSSATARSRTLMPPLTVSRSPYFSPASAVMPPLTLLMLPPSPVVVGERGGAHGQGDGEGEQGAGAWRSPGRVPPRLIRREGKRFKAF